LEGSGEGNEKFPSPPFLSPVSFPRKEIGPPLGKRPARRGRIPRATQEIHAKREDAVSGILSLVL
ncbi:hypothetical protein B5E80_18175, partial [Flavonifractor sp. An135]